MDWDSNPSASEHLSGPPLIGILTRMEDADLTPLTKIKALPRLSKSADGLNRSDVVAAFHRAFEMIGGVPRMALWASQNEDEFYRLYARLLPSATVNIGIQAAPIIMHALRPTALDNHPGQVIDLKTGLIISEEELEQKRAEG